MITIPTETLLYFTFIANAPSKVVEIQDMNELSQKLFSAFGRSDIDNLCYIDGSALALAVEAYPNFFSFSIKISKSTPTSTK